MDRDSAQLLPAGGALAPFSVHVVVNRETAGEPFARLSLDDERTRVYLASIRGDGETVVQLCALKVAREEGPAGLETGSSRAREHDLRSEETLLRRLGTPAGGAGVARLLSPAGPSELPPLLFCRQHEVFFTPPCPACFQPMVRCRDEARLLSAGLSPGAGGECIHCPSCASRGQSIFYSAQPDPGALGPEQLFDALVTALLTRRQDTLGSFPCAACAAAARQTWEDSGDPRAEWRGRWVSFTFAGGPFLLTELCPLNLDELADVLGGRPLQDLAGSPDVSSSAAWRQAWLARDLGGSDRFLFAGESSGLDAAEVLLLKLIAFRQLAAALLRHRRLTGRPHLALHPRNVHAAWSGGGEGLPALWGFRVVLAGLAAAVERDVPGLGPIVLPPASAPVPYAAPELVDQRVAGTRFGEAVLEELRPVPGSPHVFTVRGRLLDPYGVYPPPRAADRLWLTMRPDGAGSDVVFSARPAADTRPGAREVPFETSPAALEPQRAQRLAQLVGLRLPGVSYRLLPDLSTADLHSLGVVLFRLLFVNDEQGVVQVYEAARRMSEMVRSHSQRGAPALAQLAARDPELARVFDRANLLYLSAERARKRPIAIPEVLWDRTVILGCRLLQRAPAAEGAPVESTLAATVSEAAQISAELRGLLFQRQALHLEIQQVLSEISIAETLQGPPPR